MLRFRQLSRFMFADALIKSVPGHKPPSLADSAAGRYAGALFSAASEKESLDKVLDDMKYVGDLLKQSQQLRDFVKNSSTQKQQQKQIVDSFAKGNLEEISLNFLYTLVDSGRLSELSKIAEKYQEYYKILNKEEDIKVISHKELTAEEKEKVVQSIKKGKQGVQVKISYQVDPSILGGLQIYSGSTFLDCSLRSRLDKLRSQISKIA